ncbi:hypothetical protein GCM10010517_23190 [Streptosporangium fragile]|uniref:Uncharacterized protein n=1 Tax=Streptosporangium fragile TaxID=46186 RepID=A0ABN3VWG7_9ACTN
MLKVEIVDPVKVGQTQPGHVDEAASDESGILCGDFLVHADPLA